ncbi:MAG: L-threonylcarbamoyladenylate synthase [Porphyromonas sp.]|nr:L-threonylcarbamoyladenylate synthase [Porphyromonas sp.]
MILRVYNEKGNPRGTLNALVRALEDGELIIIPTDTRYSICCDALNQKSLTKLTSIKGIDTDKGHFSILCTDLSQVSTYARMDNDAFKLIKRNTPGSFTFILPTSNELPRIYKGRREVGVRIPKHQFVHGLIENFGRPLTGFSLPLPQGKDDEAYLYNPELMDESWGTQVAFVADGGVGTLALSTIIDCTQEPYEIIREGVGEIEIEE